jgi:hypothetical protein
MEISESGVNTVCVLSLFTLMNVIHKPTPQQYISIKRVLSMPGISNVITREISELTCKFIHLHNEKKETYHGQPRLLKIYPVIFHLNKKC